MKVKVSDVADRFILLADIDENERSKFLPLCSKCLRQIEASLKKEADSSCDISRLTDAAAALTFYTHILIIHARESKSFDAGDIKSTKSDKSCDFAKTLWLDAKNSISDLLYDNSFAFTVVPYRS